jgi:hypothetical protein
MTTQPAADAPATADTQEAPAPDTAANTQQSQQPIDWETRYKALQAEATRKAQALAAREQELAELRSYANEEPAEDEDGQPVRRPQRARTSEREAALEAQLQEAEWTIARSIYPDQVIDAYEAAATLLEQAETAADYVGAFEAYHLARSQGATPQQAAAAFDNPPPAAVMPRADSNRSDAPVLPEIEQKLREAEKRKDLQGWVSAQLSRLGG